MALTCDYCDYTEINALSSILVNKVIEASLAKYASKSKLDEGIEKLMEQIRQTLCLDRPIYETAYKYSRNHVIGLLDEYTKKSEKLLNVFNLMKESPKERRAHVDQFFSAEESLAMAIQIIQRFDTEYKFHCDMPNCGDIAETCRCPFVHVNCVNRGCPMKFSRHEGPSHDTICPYKILMCECGMEVSRANWGLHTANDCAHRIVPCPYTGMGCNTVMKFKDIEEHNAAFIGVHFNNALQTVNRLTNEKLKVEAELAETKRQLLNSHAHGHAHDSQRSGFYGN